MIILSLTLNRLKESYNEKNCFRNVRELEDRIIRLERTMLVESHVVQVLVTSQT